MNEELRKKSGEAMERTDKALARLTLMNQSERISFTRTKPDTTTRDMTIYYDTLTDEQKQELERIDKILFDMADEVTEEGRHILKSSKLRGKGVAGGDVKG